MQEYCCLSKQYMVDCREGSLHDNSIFRAFQPWQRLYIHMWLCYKGQECSHLVCLQNTELEYDWDSLVCVPYNLLDNIYSLLVLLLCGSVQWLFGLCGGKISYCIMGPIFIPCCITAQCKCALPWLASSKWPRSDQSGSWWGSTCSYNYGCIRNSIYYSRVSCFT